MWKPKCFKRFSISIFLVGWFLYPLFYMFFFFKGGQGWFAQTKRFGILFVCFQSKAINIKSMLISQKAQNSGEKTLLKSFPKDFKKRRGVWKKNTTYLNNILATWKFEPYIRFGCCQTIIPWQSHKMWLGKSFTAYCIRGQNKGERGEEEEEEEEMEEEDIEWWVTP